MDRIPLDRFPADRHPSMPPPSQSSFRSSDEPDSFKVSFLKGPKRKRLAKVRIPVFTIYVDTLHRRFVPVQQACDACHKSKRRCDGTGQFHFSSYLLHHARVLTSYLKRLVVIGRGLASTFPLRSSLFFSIIIISAAFASYFAAKDCTYTDSSGRPVPAPLASKSDKPPRPAPTHSRRRLQKDSYMESSLSASASGRSLSRVESLTSPPTPSDARDDGAGSSKRPRVGPISSFPTSDSQTSPPLASRSTPAAARFEVPVIRELVSRTYFVPPPFFLGFTHL